VQPFYDEPSEQTSRAQRSREKAESLYPLEIWREIEEHIFIAKSREPKGKNQKQVLEKELL
jgi:hypothetical protein